MVFTRPTWQQKLVEGVKSTLGEFESGQKWIIFLMIPDGATLSQIGSDTKTIIILVTLEGSYLSSLKCAIGL